MKKEQKKKFKSLMSTEMFEDALQILLSESKVPDSSEEIKILSKQLSAHVRRKAYNLASKKDEKGSLKLEKLLKEIIKLSGEGIYG